MESAERAGSWEGAAGVGCQAEHDVGGDGARLGTDVGTDTGADIEAEPNKAPDTADAECFGT